MFTRVPCPHCGASLRAPNDLVGKVIRCQKCDKTLRVPVPESAEAELSEADVIEADQPEEKRSTSRKRREDSAEKSPKASGKGSGLSDFPMGTLIAGVAGSFLLFVVGCVLIVTGMQSSATPPEKEIAKLEPKEREPEKKEPPVKESPKVEPPVKEPPKVEPPAKEPPVVTPPVVTPPVKPPVVTPPVMPPVMPPVKPPVVTPPEKDVPVVDPTVKEPPAPPGFALLPEKPQPQEYTEPLPAGATARLGTGRWRMTDSDTMSLAADGQSVAVASVERKTVEVWDTQTGKKLHGWEDQLLGMQLAPDGKNIVHAKFGTGYQFRDAATGNPGAALAFGDSFRSTTRFSPDGKWFAGASSPGRSKLALWEVASARKVVETQAPGTVKALAFSHDGKTLASVLDSGDILLWETATGTQTEKFKAPASTEVSHAAFTPDGSTLVTITDQTVVLWDLGKKTEADRLKAPSNPLALSQDARWMIVEQGQFETTRMTVWDVAAKKLVRILPNSVGPTRGGEFSGNGKVFATRDAGGKLLRVWNLETGKENSQIIGHASSIQALQFLADNKSLVSTGSNDGTRIWNVPDGKDPRRLAFTGSSLRARAISPDGKLAYTHDDKGQTVLLDLQTRVARPVPGGLMAGIAFSPDGKRLAIVDGKTLTLRGVDALEKATTSPPLDTTCDRVLFSPDGKYLAVGSLPLENSSNTMTRIVDATTGKILRRIAGRPYAFGANGQLVTHEPNAGMQFWNPSTGAMLKRYDVSDGNVTAIAWSPNGRFLAVADLKGVHWVDSNTQKVLATLTGQRGRINALAFSTDGKYLATGAEDSSILLWEVARIGK